MAEPRRTGVDWRRISAESAAVVFSILLAFAVDAWWDGRQERLEERALLEGLLTDFESSRPELVSRLGLARRMANGTASFRDLAPAQGLPISVAVPDTLVIAVLGGPTYEPVTNTLDAALASGEIEVIRSAALRAELANWRRILVDTEEDEREVRRVTNEQVIPLLARSVDVRPYFDALLSWSGGDPLGADRRFAESGPDDADRGPSVEFTGALVGALSTRGFYVGFSAADLEQLLASLDRCVAIIRDELRITASAAPLP